jgi:hypothetical protein
MTKKQQGEPVPATPVPDEHAGKGGSYVRNPETGVRTLMERTKDRGEDAPAAEKE